MTLHKQLLAADNNSNICNIDLFAQWWWIYVLGPKKALKIKVMYKANFAAGYLAQIHTEEEIQTLYARYKMENHGNSDPS